MSDTADGIAKVISDLRRGHTQPVILPGMDDERAESAVRAYALARELVMDPVVVDATAIYHSLVAKDEPISMYEDHPCIAPPWEEAAICYQNEHGNVIVMHSSVMPVNPLKPPWEDMADTHQIDWMRVKWRLDIFVWVGGHSKTAGLQPTHGPRHLWQFAIYPDGQPADLHWVQLVPEYPMDSWDMAHLVLLGALNFMNCRNVALVEPKRARHVQRRLDRMGVKIHTINVFPVGRTSRSPDSREDSLGTPLTSVRGHFACYGPEYNRGLLFGKYAGRYWRPQHARGSPEEGVSIADYRLVPNDDT